MAHECEFLSACCSAEPATDLDSTQEGILGYCSKCRDSTSFSCEEHTPWDDTETCPECGRILKDSKSRCFNCTASDYLEGEVKDNEQS